MCTATDHIDYRVLSEFLPGHELPWDTQGIANDGAQNGSFDALIIIFHYTKHIGLHLTSSWFAVSARRLSGIHCCLSGIKVDTILFCG